jgi:hypothetical protein
MCAQNIFNNIKFLVISYLLQNLGLNKKQRWIKIF